MWCIRCEYELTGLTDDRCPECGCKFDPDDPSSFRHTTSEQDEESSRLPVSVAVGVAVGIGAGTALGAALGNIGVGIAIGTSVGAGLGVAVGVALDAGNNGHQ